MKLIQPIRSVAVTLLRQRWFGPDRFARPFSTSHLRRKQLLAARRGQFTPPVHYAHPIHHHKPACDPCDRVRPQAWPYDTPLPVGLPRLPEMPGTGPDNTRLPLTRPALPSPAQGQTDHRGKIIDFTV